MQIETGAKKNNNIKKAKGRSTRKGAARPKEMIAAIQEKVDAIERFDHTNKYQLAGEMQEQYRVPIGEINHAIERAMRAKLYNWIVVEIAGCDVLSMSQLSGLYRTVAAKFVNIPPAEVSRLAAIILQRNKESNEKQ